MSAINFLFAGFAVFWAGLFTYLIILQLRIRTLRTEIEQIENDQDSQDTKPESRNNPEYLPKMRYA